MHHGWRRTNNNRHSSCNIMLNFDLDPSFETNCIAIRQLIDSEGGLIPPNDDEGGLRLAGWLLDLKEGTMGAERQTEVTEVLRHFETTRREDKLNWIWKGRFFKLLEYRREYHTFIISKNDLKHQRLRRWVIKQREKEKDGTLLPKRKELMVKEGFDFRPCVASRKRKYTFTQQSEWSDMCDMLVDFKNQHGHCNVGFHDTNNRKLAVCFNMQRANYKLRTMPSDRIIRLNTIGFAWYFRAMPDTDAHVQNIDEQPATANKPTHHVPVDGRP
jgi:hypothetical protein